MKMPHVDDHTIRSSHSPHHHPHHEDRAARHHHHYDKRSADPEMSPRVRRHEAHSPHHYAPHGESHYHPSMEPPTSANMSTPPPSPHVPPRYDYSSYDHYHRGGPPYGQRGGYSYYHAHPNSRPPMMPREMLPYPPPHYHAHHPADVGPPPPYTGSYPHHMPPPGYDTPPLTPSSTSYYHDQQYPNFLPPSNSMTTTASSRSGTSASLVPSRDEEEYAYDPHSPQTAGSHEEVNQVGPNDVLCGRGAPTNYHPGNEYFRELVNEYKSTYLASKRADKPFVASHIVNIVQSRGGRFLRRYKRNGVSWERGHFVWVEVDPQKAYEKACQALRENAPEIRRKMRAEGSDGEDDSTATGRTQQPEGERIQEQTRSDASPKEENKDKQSSDAAAKQAENNEDNRNDEMEDSERS